MIFPRPIWRHHRLVVVEDQLTAIFNASKRGGGGLSWRQRHVIIIIDPLHVSNHSLVGHTRHALHSAHHNHWPKNWLSASIIHPSIESEEAPPAPWGGIQAREYTKEARIKSKNVKCGMWMQLHKTWILLKARVMSVTRRTPKEKVSPITSFLGNKNNRFIPFKRNP